MLKGLRDKYQGKRVFLTGHTGFKGAWLTALLHTLGAQVKGYALAPENCNSISTLLQLEHIAENIIGDIRDKENLTEAVISFQPDFIFHLAAQPLVRRSYTIPSETFEVNVIGTANILEAANKLQGKCTIVVITTDKVYENKEQHILYKEDDVLGGYDPYSASKACAELVVSSFRNSFFSIQQYSTHKKALASARAGNVIGGGDWSENRIIPDIVRALQTQKAIDVRNPYSIRPWQHVLEPLYGYLKLGVLLDDHPQRFSKAYNFGPQSQDHLTVKELVESSIKTWGGGNWRDTSDKAQPHEAGLLQLDITRAREELLWIPKLSSATAIEWTITWYKQPREQQAVFTYQQIKAYLEL